MNRFIIAGVLAGLVTGGAAWAADPEPKTDVEKTMYALGFDLSNKLGPFKITPAELEFLKAGLTDAMNKKTARVDMATYAPKINTLAQTRQAAGAADEKKKGKAYLETIAAKQGIKKTGTGLLMETIVEGKGKALVKDDNAKVNYKGMLIDGKVFDESAKHGGPQTFKVGGIIKCWNEGLEFMKVGGKAKLYCPPELGWGDQPNGDIPAGATTVFEIEVVDVVK